MRGNRDRAGTRSCAGGAVRHGIAYTRCGARAAAAALVSPRVTPARRGGQKDSDSAQAPRVFLCGSHSPARRRRESSLAEDRVPISIRQPGIKTRSVAVSLPEPPSRASASAPNRDCRGARAARSRGRGLTRANVLQQRKWFIGWKVPLCSARNLPRRADIAACGCKRGSAGRGSERRACGGSRVGGARPRSSAMECSGVRHAQIEVFGFITQGKSRFAKLNCA